jgi:hypothetical protein
LESISRIAIEKEGKKMPENVREYRTGQGVPKSGEYLCQSGERVKLKADQEFPVCPISGEDTTWKDEK